VLYGGFDMSVRTWAQKLGQYLTNIKLLITILPMIGISIGYFQSDNIKKLTQSEPIEQPIAPQVEAPQVEHTEVKHVETVIKVKDYEPEIKRLFAAVEALEDDNKKLYQKIITVDQENTQQQEQIDAVKKWIGFND
jgi:predicted RNase H-like nuclease (RuvC/YqgF family)